MDTSYSGLMNLLVQKMGYLNQRQSVLAENVANVDTPNYKERDLTPFTFGDAMKQANVTMAVTNPRDILPPSMAGVNAKTVKVDTGTVAMNGNTVDVDQQMMAVSQNAVQYKMVTSIYHKISNLFHIALTGNTSG